MDKIVALCKRRGFIFPSSEIYGGVGSTYDFGHYGVLLKGNVKGEWWRAHALRSARTSWRSTRRSCSTRACGRPRGTSRASPTRWWTAAPAGSASAPTTSGTWRAGANPPSTPGRPRSATSPSARDFNLMFETTIGPVKESGATAYLRPETAQGIFINFKNVLQFSRKRPPFGIAQIGKSFRNEITPGNFIFRTREFEQMEMEYFVPPADAQRWFEHWLGERMRWYTELGLRPDHLRLRAHDPDELSHYSSGTSDVEYLFPIGWSELEGIANRGDFDLTQHAQFSGEKLEYFDQATGERYVPHVIEPAAGADRATLAFMVDAYDEEVVAREGAGEGERRTVLRLHPRLAPVKVAVLPLVNKDGQPELAREVYRAVRELVQAEYDDGGAIGKRYRRQDEIGTPFCVTVDHESVAGRHGHGARPRLADAGAPAHGGSRAGASAACPGAVDDAQAGGLTVVGLVRIRAALHLKGRAGAGLPCPAPTAAAADERQTTQRNCLADRKKERHGLRPDRRAAPDPRHRARVHRQGDRRAHARKRPQPPLRPRPRQEGRRAGLPRRDRPPEYGGAGLDYFSYGLVVEEIGRGDSAIRTVISVQTSLVCSGIVKFATEAQKHKYLPKLCSGEWLGCFALTEPDTGSDAANQKTRAHKTDSGWVLNGAKMWISMGNYAKVAMIFAQTDPALGHKGIACFLVDTDQPGYSAQTIEHKMGLHASDTASISLEDVEVADEDMLGEVGDGFKIAMSNLDSGRYSVAAGCVGICRGCVEASVAYAKEREQFGGRSPPSSSCRR